jgi:O-antigen ligase
MQRDHAGAWRGLFLHKNLLAANLALAVLACGLLALGDPRARGWAGAAALVALLQLPLARSVGGAFALGLAALPVGVVAWQQRSRRRGLALVVAGGLTALLAVLLIAHADTLLGWVGRDATLSRRTDIWTGSLATLRAHPWLGHGFGAFWTSAPERIPLFHGLGFAPRHAHNGLVDLALGLGLAGLLVFLAVYARELARALRLALGRPEWLGLWPLALLAWWIASNCHESALVGGAGLGWVLFVALAATPPGGSRARPL